MITQKLFQKDVYLQACDAEITGIFPYEKKQKENGCFFILTLDRTVFFPVGGGQSCDTGTINGFKVKDVYEQDNTVFHRILLDDHNDTSSLTEGAKVRCKIDWAHRFDNMQRHCGEHILSGMFYKLCGAVNRGFHMGDDYMTVDMKLEDNPEYKTITWETALKAEEMTNNVIWSDLPIIVRHFDKREDAENLPLRKKLSIDEDITIVCVGDENNPSDCVACCGTHPARSSQVGLLKIYKVEKNKDMFRIYFEAGKRAMADFDKKHEIITELGIRYSAGTDDLLKKIYAREHKMQSAKEELDILRRSVIASRVSEIKADIAAAPAIHIYKYSDMKADDLRRIGESAVEETSGVVIIVSESDSTILLFSDGSFNCGKYVKDHANDFSARGGGKNKSARAVFTSTSDIDAFVKSVRTSYLKKGSV